MTYNSDSGIFYCIFIPLFCYCSKNTIKLATILGGTFNLFCLKKKLGTSLVIHWLRLHASKAGGAGSIPDQGTEVPHATQCGKKRKKKSLPEC